MATKYRFQTLEDFLIANPLTIDDVCDDGWGAYFPIKGREISGTVLFADISGFSRRTANLTPAETLAFVNTFFAWITAEALRDGFGIVDKYIGDEIMVVFSREFGSEDPFIDAIKAARAMGQSDFLSYRPHIGIASGDLIVGYTGTAVRHSCSVFGATVALASRCAGVVAKEDSAASSRIVFPASEWGERRLSDVLPTQYYLNADGSKTPRRNSWELSEPRSVQMKNVGEVLIREIENRAFHVPSQRAEDRAVEAVENARLRFNRRAD
jgi:class 3 adenylate cyclase